MRFLLLLLFLSSFILHPSSFASAQSAASQVTAHIAPSLSISTDPVVITDPPWEEFGVWSVFHVSTNADSLSLSAVTTVLTNGSVAIPVNQPRGVNFEAAGCVPAPGEHSLQYYESAADYGGLPGFRSGTVTYVGAAGGAIGDCDIYVNPGWSSTADLLPGDYTGWVVLSAYLTP